MKNLLTFKTAIMMMALLLIYSCETKENIVIEPLTENTNYQGSNEQMLVLGKQKENPYTVENMRKAYANLTSNGRVADFDIQSTDLYIKFKPSDSLELEILKADTSLILWDYPLDYEVETIGHYYHDPDLPSNVPTYQYTVVKPDFDYPDIEYEILAELLLPDEGEEESNGRVASSFLEQLEDEALRITGNLDTTQYSNNARRSKWRPSGTYRQS